MITVTKTICHYANGDKRIDKSCFRVKDTESLDMHREAIRSDYGCECVTFYYYEE